jgi:hypothetical protein
VAGRGPADYPYRLGYIRVGKTVLANIVCKLAGEAADSLFFSREPDVNSNDNDRKDARESAAKVATSDTLIEQINRKQLSAQQIEPHPWRHTFALAHLSLANHIRAATNEGARSGQAMSRRWDRRVKRLVPEMSA